jgi:Ser/Thr protein kinase RdoA (MazF antagonist)
VSHDFPALARTAASRHGFGPDARLTAFSVTENPAFRVEGDGRDPIVLRIYHPGGRPEAEIRSELAWMTALRAHGGVPVPEVVAAPDGARLLDLGEAEAPVYAVAFAAVPGRELSDDDLPATIARLGALTARLHVHARGWTPPAGFARPRWDLRTTLGDAPHWGPWERGVPDAAERRQLARLAGVVARRLTRFGVGRERFGLVHADLRMANLIHDGRDVTIIDFDDAGLSWYLYDLAGTLTFCEGRADVGDLIAAWVGAYRGVAPLPADDAREIPTFLMLRRLLLSAYIGLRAGTELAAELHATGFNAESCRLAEAYLSEFG